MEDVQARAWRTACRILLEMRRSEWLMVVSGGMPAFHMISSFPGSYFAPSARATAANSSMHETSIQSAQTRGASSKSAVRARAPPEPELDSAHARSPDRRKRDPYTHP